MRTLTPGLLAGALATVILPHAAASVPVFRSGVELVNLTVTVSDARDGYVQGLRAEDFVVYEDGVPQELTVFAEDEVPLSVVVLLDGSLSMRERLPETQTAALRFLHTLRPQDEAQVMAFNGRTRVVQDFTGDRTMLTRAIESIDTAGATALYNSVYVALKDLQARRSPDQIRREAVVVLSDGDDTASLISDDQVLELARQAGIPVYGVRLRSPALDALRMNPGQANFFFAAVTRQTGGQVHFADSATQLRGVYDRLAEELRSQYTLGYVSSNPAQDGQWRQIVVRLKGPGSVQLRHRSGYYAGKD